MMPVAPARLSMTIGWPSSSVMRGPIRRAVMSVGPPAENGTTMRIGLAGKGCDSAGAAKHRPATRNAIRNLGFISPPPRCPYCACKPSQPSARDPIDPQGVTVHGVHHEPVAVGREGQRLLRDPRDALSLAAGRCVADDGLAALARRIEVHLDSQSVRARFRP